MRLRNVWVSALGLTLAVSIVACGGKQETSSTSAEPSSGAGSGEKVDASKAGDVKGMVTLEGSAPKNEPIKMNADPVCVKENKSPQFQETYAVGSDGKSFANVFVYVKDGLGNYVYDAPTEVGLRRDPVYERCRRLLQHAADELQPKRVCSPLDVVAA